MEGAVKLTRSKTHPEKLIQMKKLIKVNLNLIDQSYQSYK